MKNVKSIRSNDMKELNRLSVLKILRQDVCSRAEISAALGMSKPAVSALVDELIMEGLVVETGRGESTEAGGKRPILLDINTNAGMIAAVYFNNDFFETALTNIRGEVLFNSRKSIKFHNDYRITLDTIITEMKRLIHEARIQHFQQPILACGVCLKGLVNTENGIMKYSAGIPHWRDIPIRAHFESALKVPVFVENDARAYTFALLVNSASEKTRTGTIACVNVGQSSLGTGIAINNEVYRGYSDGAVTFAHTTVSHDGPQCECGKRGCWQALASISGFLKELGKRNMEYAQLDFATALKKYREGDELVRDVVLNYTAYWLGVGLANLLDIFNPEVVYILGDITLAGNEVGQAIVDVAKGRALPVSREARIIFSRELSESIHIKGAAAVMIEYMFSPKYHRLLWDKMDSYEEG